MKVRRERVLPAPPAAVWEVLGDPYALARWWPRVERVESVDHAGYTEVYRTAKGRQVRADFRIAALEAERELRVVQQLEGTPFERIFTSAGKRMALEPADGGTRVVLEIEQEPARMARFGSFLLRRALRRQLDEGLDALSSLLSPA